jgi:hypothetical protein
MLVEDEEEEVYSIHGKYALHQPHFASQKEVVDSLLQDNLSTTMLVEASV